MLDIRRIPIGALIGLVLTALFLLAAIFAPLIAPYGLGEIVGDVWEPMSAEHWLGTDNLGRDLLSRMIYGARTTIFIAVVATALSFSLGSVLGFTAAVVGGWFDMLMSRFVDLLMAIPTLIFGARRAVGAADHAADADPGHGHPRFDPRLPPVARGRGRHQRHGLRRGGQAARRGHAAGSSSARSCPTRCRRWSRSSACASSMPCCSSRRCPSSASACSRRKPTGAAWSRRTRTASSSASPAALIPAAAIAALAISVNLVADWILNRTTSLKGGRG